MLRALHYGRLAYSRRSFEPRPHSVKRGGRILHPFLLCSEMESSKALHGKGMKRSESTDVDLQKNIKAYILYFLQIASKIMGMKSFFFILPLGPLSSINPLSNRHFSSPAQKPALGRDHHPPSGKKAVH